MPRILKIYKEVSKCVDMATQKTMWIEFVINIFYWVLHYIETQSLQKQAAKWTDTGILGDPL